MADVSNYVNPLSGRDVVEDILGQIRRRLHGDCSLRAEDGYSGGYGGEVVIKIKCHAVRSVAIDMTIPVTQSPSLAAPAPDTFAPDELEEIVVDETIKIPIEENLTLVRDRIVDNSERAIADETEKAEEAEAEQAPEEHRAKRKYTRRAALAGAVSE